MPIVGQPTVAGSPNNFTNPWFQPENDNQYWTDVFQRNKSIIQRDAPANGGYTLTNMLRNFGASLGANAGSAGIQGFPQGYGNLMQILQSQGQIDPALRNRELSNIDRGTQTAQTQQRGELARGGMQGSGVGQAIMAAIGQSGQDRRADVTAKHNEIAADRGRSDLGLFLQLLVDPALTGAGITSGVDVQRAQIDSANRNATQDRYFGGFGAILQALGLG